MSDDAELLGRYARLGDEQAFGELVRRYVDLVYGAALRQVRDAHLAEDVTQTVFLRLARKADSLPGRVVLAGWLHADTRLTALQTLRAERRRAAREEAATMNKTEEAEDHWTEVRPIVDEVLGELDAEERGAVLLRFFSGRSFQEVGSALRLTPDAARMRVNRAVEKLRDLLEKRGVKTTAAALGAALLAHGVEAAPPGIGPKVLARMTPGLAAAAGMKPAWFSKAALATGALALLIGVMVVSAKRTPPAVPDEKLVELAASAPAAQLAPLAVAAPDDRPAPPRTRTLHLKVIDGATGSALEGVAVEASLFTDVLRRGKESFRTGPDGAADIVMPAIFQHEFYHRLTLTKDGYVPRYVSWSVFQHDTMDDIPAEYTATLDHGVEIGGTVRDPGGQGIEGVNLVFSGPSPAGVPPRERDTTMGDYHTETTDAAGHWRCSHIRREFRSTTFRLEHRNFQTVTYACEESDQPSRSSVKIPQADYLGGRAEMRMIPGILLSGHVVDSAGRPIRGATVTRDRDWYRESATAMTGADGGFTFGDLRPGSLTLTVQARSFAPEAKTLEVEAELRDVRIELSPSAGLRGNIVDQAGVPVAGAEISPAQDERNRAIYKWSAHSDDLGGFFWDSAPNSAVGVNVFAYGFQRTNVTLQPGNDIQTITLVRTAEPEMKSIKIRVVDAATQQPAANARIYAEEYGSFRLAGQCIDGSFTFKSFEPGEAYRFEARAPGYLPERTEALTIGTNREVQIALRKGDFINGIVLGPGGEPVAGADVALCTEEKGAIIAAGRIAFMDNSILARTDENGRFSHVPAAGAHSLCAVHGAGFAMVRLSAWENGSALQLRGWGRIAGVALLNGQPAGNIEIGAFTSAPNGNERGLNLNSYFTMTDAEGRFRIDQLPPIEMKLAWMIPNGRGKSFSHSVPVRVQPGGVTEVQMNLSGRTVTGRLKFDGEVDWARQILNAALNVDQGKLSFGEPGADPEAIRRSYTEFWQSEAGREWDRKNRSFAIQVRPDGSFEAVAVPAGRYTASVSIGGVSSGPAGFRRPIAMLRQTVIVPEGEEAFDLGEIEFGKQN